MKTMTKRLENAVTKLYTTFHKGTLNAFDCKACAVGNIVGHGIWGGWHMDELGVLDCEDNYPKIKDYSEAELKNVELKFLTPWINNNIWGEDNGYNKELQFKGLCAVVEYLCELDNYPNVMDIKSLFDYNEKGAVKQLKEIV